jgi:hypothetical protein
MGETNVLLVLGSRPRHVENARSIDDVMCPHLEVFLGQLGAVYTCDFPYESPYDSVYDLLPKVSSKLGLDFFC